MVAGLQSEKMGMKENRSSVLGPVVSMLDFFC